MERTRNLKDSLKKATVVVFFAAALLSTGCSNNALMNPQIDSNAQGTSTAQPTSQDLNPSSQELNP